MWGRLSTTSVGTPGLRGQRHPGRPRGQPPGRNRSQSSGKRPTSPRERLEGHPVKGFILTITGLFHM